MVGMVGKIKSKSWQCTELGGNNLHPSHIVIYNAQIPVSVRCTGASAVYSGQEEMSVPHAAQCKYVCIAAP